MPFDLSVRIKELNLALSLGSEHVKVTLCSPLAGNSIGPLLNAGVVPARVSRCVISDTAPSDALWLASAGPLGAGTKWDGGSWFRPPSVSRA